MQDEVLHVVHVVTSLEPGGLENGVVNLALSLNPQRFRTSIVCLERYGEFCERLPPEVEVVCLDKPPGFKVSASFQLGKILTRMEADIIHTHNLGPLIYGSLARRFSMSNAIMVQGEHAELRPDEKTLRRRAMRRLCYRECAAVHTVSSSLREELIEFGLPESKIKVVRNGVDCDRFAPGNSEGDSVGGLLLDDPDRFIIGIVGRFGAFKRHDILIAAFENLSEMHRDLHLLIVGDHGVNRESVLNLVENSPAKNRITWTGFLQDPLPAYQAMDLLVIPSENEGLSNAMLEAMACGVPCLAHPACGASEVIRDGENGYLHRMVDGRGLAEDLAEILDDRERVSEMGRVARENAREQFSLDAMVKGYESLYEKANSESK